MSAPTAATSYKKQDGTLALSKDGKSATWTPTSGSSPTLTIDAYQITNLQQTAEDKPKVMLKIFVQESGSSEPISHVFTFTARENARPQANAIRDGLQKTLAQKAAQNAVTSAATNGQSAAMTIANAISGGRQGNAWEDDERLLSDVRLQQSFMRENPELQKTFLEAKSEKPDSLSLLQFTKQFWASRVHLLRAYSLSHSQNKGSFNVFSEIKKSEGGTTLNLTSEHIKAIFEQYPVMRMIYDEIVPKRIKSEIEFWQRFFQSQLYSTLRGMKIDRRAEQKDVILDTYLDHPELTGRRATAAELHIPKFIDLEGNEENHSQRQGNRPDEELRQTALDKAPIIRRLNALSEKLMIAVRPSDVDASAPIGIDEHEYEQLRLRDLAAQAQQERIKLNIRDQSRFFSDSLARTEDEQVVALRKLDPGKAIQQVLSDLKEHVSDPTKSMAALEIDLDEDEDMLDGEEGATKPITGSIIAGDHILALTRAHRDQTSETPGDATDPKREQKASGLSESIFDRLKLVHATTLEFLRQFWNAFLSGDASRVEEIASLSESLEKALERINTIATDAQTERKDRIKDLERQRDEHFKKTGKRRQINLEKIGGGEVVVKQLLGPIIRSLLTAVEKYRAVHAVQMREIAQQGDAA